MNKKLLIVVVAAVVLTIVLIIIISLARTRKADINEHTTKTDVTILTTKKETAIQEYVKEEADIFALAAKCKISSGISDDALLDMAAMRIGNDQRTKDYLFCYLNAMGILNANGKFQINARKLKQWMPDVTHMKIATLTVACGGELGVTPGDTALLVYKCLKTDLTTQTNENEIATLTTSTTKFVKGEGAIFALAEKCTISSGISDESLLDIGALRIGNDQTVKKYLFCLLNAMGILNDNGKFKINVHKLKQWMPDITPIAIARLTLHCGEKIGKTSGETALLVYKCIKKVE